MCKSDGDDTNGSNSFYILFWRQIRDVRVRPRPAFPGAISGIVCRSIDCLQPLRTLGCDSRTIGHRNWLQKNNKYEIRLNMNGTIVWFRTYVKYQCVFLLWKNNGDMFLSAAIKADNVYQQDKFFYFGQIGPASSCLDTQRVLSSRTCWTHLTRVR